MYSSSICLFDTLENAVELFDAFFINIPCLLKQAYQGHAPHHPLEGGIVLHALRHIAPAADAWAIIRSMIAPASGLERSSARVSEME